jgi:hypothetical protein
MIPRSRARRGARRPFAAASPEAAPAPRAAAAAVRPGASTPAGGSAAAAAPTASAARVRARPLLRLVRAEEVVEAGRRVHDDHVVAGPRDGARRDAVVLVADDG